MGGVFELTAFAEYLREGEKSAATVEKYVRDVRAFSEFSDGDLSKEILLNYKTKITAEYAVRSVNSMIASLNSWLEFIGRPELKLKALRLQREVFCDSSRELTRGEYFRLIETAEKAKKCRLSLILQTLGGTGIRISELRFITVEAVIKGTLEVSLKGKIRRIFIVKKLQKKLLDYAKSRKITGGQIFLTRSGRPVCRTAVWREMKALAVCAGIAPGKVFPHNLRHLFARSFYAVERDIARLADVLGHSSIDTTRIYIVTTADEHRKMLEKMRLIL